MLEWRKEALLSQVNLSKKESGQTLSLEIAGVGIECITRDSKVHQFSRNFFKDYLSNARAETTVYIESSKQLELWNDPDPEFTLSKNTAFHRDFAAKIDGNSIYAVVGPEIEDALHNLLRWVLPPLLLRKNALLLHGAGLVYENQGYVFFGHSGAGKSTISQLVKKVQPDAQLLGDDAVIVSTSKNKIYLHSAPLGCGYSKKAPPKFSVPVRSFVALCQSRKNQLLALSISEQVQALAASTMQLDASILGEQTLDLCAKITATHPPIKKLFFTKDTGFWNLLNQRGTNEKRQS